ncbi:membrane protein FxsA [Mergibacter septicus]|uniref:Membrane protein FxsA n=1 Tax=Mergibacter septicus TaxID=221402 RepID=A0A8D4LLQ6_9PAST|nr:FxsA family protein [Mergibacter septicus]AWX14887.1 membrane protein FxsA [Mergibacter septicus]QDJ14139.1 membrane protein FxsA [Mergibacter septicus]UTU48411.1 FxsA family protein [Mergibacter septicus]WMR95960.1 FxsA family protein [Mergibacter septicus]
MPLLMFVLILFSFIYLEVSLLVWLGSAIGVLPLLALLFLSSCIGLFMIRTQGLYTLLSVRSQLQRGELPTRALFQSGIWILAGILFFIPSLLTDILALFLLIPSVGLSLEAFISRKIHLFSHHHSTFTPNQDDIIDAEYQKKADDDKKLH